MMDLDDILRYIVVIMVLGFIMYLLVMPVAYNSGEEDSPVPVDTVYVVDTVAVVDSVWGGYRAYVDTVYIEPAISINIEPESNDPIPVEVSDDK